MDRRDRRTKRMRQKARHDRHDRVPERPRRGPRMQPDNNGRRAKHRTVFDMETTLDMEDY